MWWLHFEFYVHEILANGIPCSIAGYDLLAYFVRYCGLVMQFATAHQAPSDLGGLQSCAFGR